MTKVHSLEDWENSINASAYGITIGNFDGVHKGHRQLLIDFKSACDERDLTPVVFTFVPHPEIFFNPGKRHLLTSYEKKYELLGRLGFENVVEIGFEKIRHLSGLDFVESYVFEDNKTKLLWVGHDFTFGKDRVDPCGELAKRFPMEIKACQPFKLDAQTVSSSLIRKLLEEGELKKANEFLGTAFSVIGTVEHGKKLGRKIGFPTINLKVDYPSILPKFGVYKVSAKVDGQTHLGVMNVGINPSVGSDMLVKWEAHLLNFDGDLYHKEVEIMFEDFIRPERKFASVEELRKQIRADVAFVEQSGA